MNSSPCARRRCSEIAIKGAGGKHLIQMDPAHAVPSALSRRFRPARRGSLVVLLLASRAQYLQSDILPQTRRAETTIHPENHSSIMGAGDIRTCYEVDIC
jgi:hypothetical protein